jgi:hypothetical protein
MVITTGPKQGEQSTFLHAGDIENITVRINGNGTCFSDPAFATNKTLPIHRWVPWIAGFSSAFVKDALNRHLKSESMVLDPFAGVGTTLVEAALAGHNVLGCEINPYAALACRTKLNAHMVDIEAFLNEIRNFKEFYYESINSEYKPISVPPKGFKTRDCFYSSKVEHKVLIVWDFIDKLKIETIRDLFSLAFASTMVQYSNYSYEPSLGRRVSAGRDEILDFAVGESIITKLKEMASDAEWFKNSIPNKRLNTNVINDSFFNYREFLPSRFVDLVITSPPYLNNYHYNRNTRPQLYWLKYVAAPNDLKSLENHNFGKYWQTVREMPNLGLNFTLPSSEITNTLQSLRNLHGEKGIYGGNGWANYAASYFNDCLKFAQGLNYILKPGGTALVVIGNSILQGISIPTDKYFAEIAASVGLQLVEVHIPRTTRVGSSIIQSKVRVEKADNKHHLYEAIVELRKP